MFEPSCPPIHSQIRSNEPHVPSNWIASTTTGFLRNFIELPSKESPKKPRTPSRAHAPGTSTRRTLHRRGLNRRASDVLPLHIRSAGPQLVMMVIVQREQFVSRERLQPSVIKRPGVRSDGQVPPVRKAVPPLFVRAANRLAGAVESRVRRVAL